MQEPENPPAPPLSPSASPPSAAAANSYEQDRRQKLQKLRDLGVDPFGGRTPSLTPLGEVRASHKPEYGQDGGPVFKAAGRVMLKRDMGKLSFLTLRDETGDLQVALDKRRLDPADPKAWEVRNLIDLGDQIVVEGPLGATKTGEPTIWATALSMASKALLTPPAKWEGLSDVEARYRQRYVDLWANPDVMRVLKLRMRIVEEVRKYMRNRGFLEVETPMMQPLAGGAVARPFVTHHNALDIPLYLRIAPELYLKRLLVGGFNKVFELNRNFRNEGISPRHNPEFTMLEAYEAYGSWETMAELVEGMICHVAETVLGTLRIMHPNGREINLEGDTTQPLGRRWLRVRMADLVEERTGWKFDKRPIIESAPDVYARIIAGRFVEHGEQWIKQASAGVKTHLAEMKDDPAFKYAFFRRIFHNIQGEDATPEGTSGALLNLLEQANAPVNALALASDFCRDNPVVAELTFKIMIAHDTLRELSPAEQLVEVYEKLVEPKLVDPTFVTHVPSVIIPLARRNRDDPFFADVYELAINGQEISPGYSELNDPDVQEANFAHQVGDKDEQQKTDNDFLTALKFGMPPAGGMGLGIDRLVMMLTGAESIRDVILFPLMKPVE